MCYVIGTNRLSNPLLQAMKNIHIILFSLCCFASFNVVADNEYPVGITPEMPYIDIQHEGQTVTVKRIQDTSNKLTDDFTKTSRACPPFCIHPMIVAPDVETVSEIELLEFLNTKVKDGKGLLVDARTPEFFKSETIPGSINIPFVLFTGENSQKVFGLLGAKEVDGKLDYTDAKELTLFCNGPWCDQSPRAIKALIKSGYPASKLKYYRGGMQLWKILGLTTVLPELNTVEKPK